MSGAASPHAEQARCADVIWAFGDATPVGRLRPGLTGDELMVQHELLQSAGLLVDGAWSTPPQWRSAQIPSTNTHATATGVARHLPGLLEPGRLLSPGLLAEATSPQSVGYCPVLGEEVTFGLGFKPTTPAAPVRPQSVGLRPLRDRRRGRLRRPRRRGRLRLRHEPRHPPLAEHPEPVAHRRRLRLPLTEQAGRRPGRVGGTAVWQCVGVREARP